MGSNIHDPFGDELSRSSAAQDPALTAVNGRPTKRKPFLVRLWNGFWGFVDGTRRLVFNIIFILLLVLLFKALFGAGEQFVLKPNTALVVQPYGHIVEQYSGDPLDRALSEALDRQEPEVRLRDIIKSIRAAKNDDRISRLILIPDYIWSAGLASLQELEAAVTDFKTSGKPVLTYAENMAQHQYYFAALADEIWMNPSGFVWVDGYARYRNFYKDALDKLAVEINLFRVGEYKSAMEPFIRNNMSEEAREANAYWINNLWRQYLDGVARNRGLPLEVLNRSIENYAVQLDQADGDFAAFALNEGLVDQLVSRPEFRSAVIQAGAAADRGDSFRQVYFRNYLGMVEQSRSTGKSVAVVTAEGSIVGGDEPPGVISADATARKIRRAAHDDRVAAVVFRVNSPGGSAFASEIVRRELQSVREAGKPIVISMGDVAASGGYWISLASDEIWTQPATITGSIGIFGMIPTFPQTLAKLGIYNDGVGSTPLAGAIRPERSLTDDARRIFQRSTERGYEEFINRVAAAREMEPADVDQIARGRVWSGEQALERGLVDQLGGLQQAVAAAAKRAGLSDDYTVDFVEPRLSAFERFLVNMTAGVASVAGIDDWFKPSNILTSNWAKSGLVQRLLDDLSLISAADEQFALYAHCLCDLK